MYSDEPAPDEAGPFILGAWAQKMQSYLEERAAREADHPFVDASYREVVEDAMAVVERTCAAAGLDLTDEARAAIRARETDNPQGKHGRHEYGMAEVALTEAAIREAFAAYQERFAEYL